MVICPGIGRDAHISYTTLRRLAIELAQGGYSTLRFDYPGTGDSLDVSTDDPAVAWLHAVDDAITYLRTSGVRRIVLCGYRVGALFSLFRAAGRTDIDDLVLIDPVVSGAAFLREFNIAASVGAARSQLSGSALEIDGTPFASGPSSILLSMNALSMRSRPAKRILLLTSSTARDVTRLPEYLTKLGVEITQASFEPIQEFSRDGCIGETVNLGVVHEWLPPATEKIRTTSSISEVNNQLSGQDFVEEPLRFADGLFGVLCRPSFETEPGRVVLIGNCGLAPRYGPARFHVFLARRLAAAGIASLRLDFAGLGDSWVSTTGTDTHIYETCRSADVSAAIDTLVSRGHRGFAAAGICSGAYHAWRAALDDDRIDTVLMVNPAVFIWRKGQSLGALVQTGSRSAQSYLAAMSQGDSWKHLFSRNFGIRRALRTGRVVATRQAVAFVGKAAVLAGLPVESAHPMQAMQRLSQRGTRVLVVMAAGDAGLDVLSSCFGTRGRRLARLPGHAVEIIPDLDHAVTRRVMQDTVAKALLHFLTTKLEQPRRRSALRTSMVVSVNGQNL